MVVEVVIQLMVVMVVLDKEADVEVNHDSWHEVDKEVANVVDE